MKYLCFSEEIPSTRSAFTGTAAFFGLSTFPTYLKNGVGLGVTSLVVEDPSGSNQKMCHC